MPGLMGTWVQALSDGAGPPSPVARSPGPRWRKSINSNRRDGSLHPCTADDSGPSFWDNFMGGIKLSYEVFTIQPLMRNLLTVTGQEEGFLVEPRTGINWGNL